MKSRNYDSSKSGKRWVSYFDWLGFANYSSEHDLTNVFCETYSWLEFAEQEGQDFSNVESRLVLRHNHLLQFDPEILESRFNF